MSNENPAPAQAPTAIIVAPAGDGWLVEVGAQMHRYASLAEAREHARQAAQAARARGEAVELVDLPAEGDAEAGELLVAGQEEVFSATEVASGRIEHQVSAGEHTEHPADPPGEADG
jgi:hypothetical protein